jgi:hypothetical protein
MQVAGPVLHQQDEPARALVARVRLHADLDTEDRLDARLARRAVELDRAEEVADIGDRQRRLAIRSGRRDDAVDAQRAVDDRVLGVRAQVNESHAAF